MKLQFPTMLRKMWSGSEVQKWLDEQSQTPWLDIKSAPKGATIEHPSGEHWILGVNEQGQQKVIRWCLEYPSEGCWMFAYEPNDYIPGIQEFYPTHWMPLFDAPNKQNLTQQ